MKIINLGRGQGKTTRLLYASEWNDTPILCGTYQQKQYLMYRAKELRLNIPEPICVSEIISNKATDNHVMDRDLLIDEAHWVLQNLLKSFGMSGEIKAITLTADER